jgi:hypothetical protein
MIEEVLTDRFTQATDLFNNQKINKHNYSVSAIKRMLDEEGLNTYRPRIISFIAEKNKETSLDFY